MFPAPPAAPGHVERSMKSGFWKTDWFLGLAVVIALVIFNR
jgi:hypothetical protein